MTWHTSDGKRLADIELAKKMRKVAREIADRNAEHKPKPPGQYVWRDVEIPSPRLKPFIEKIRTEMAEAQKLEDEQ